MGGQMVKSPKPRRSKSEHNHHRYTDNGHFANGGHDRAKHLSCPDMGGATPYENYDESPNKIHVKVYRSYGNLDTYIEQERMRYSRPDVRIYRRSTGNVSEVSSGESGTRTTSTPRVLQRTRSADRDRLVSSSNGAPRGGLDLWKMRTSSLDRERVTTPSTTLSSASAGESLASVCEFPGVEEICRKIKLFEESFCHSVGYKFRSLDENFQLCKVCVARCASHDVSLMQYLESRADIPEDLEDNHYELTIPRAFYVLLRFLRRAAIQDRKQWRMLARDIVDAVSFEVGKELSRVYEYQIVMLKEFIAIKLLSAHAADCIIEHLIKKQVMLERNSALSAVLLTRPPKAEYGNTRFSVILGERELKWDLADIFKKPGVRREFGLFESDDDVTYDVHYRVTWRFYGCRKDCEPQHYGYRGQMLDWDYHKKIYKLQYSEKLYATEIPINFQEVTHQYIPFHKLVGYEAMRRYLEYLSMTNVENISFERFIRNEYGYCGGRDGCFVYRPQAVLPSALSWEMAVIENMDLTRLYAPEVTFAQLKRSCLIGSEYVNLQLQDGAPPEDCDLSYCTMVGSVPEGAPPRRHCRTSFCAIVDYSEHSGFKVTGAMGHPHSIVDEVESRKKRPEPEPVSATASSPVDSRCLQLATSARRITAERIRDPDAGGGAGSGSINTQQRRKRLQQRHLQTTSSDSSHSSTDYHVLDGPPPPKPPHRTVSRPLPQQHSADEVLTKSSAKMTSSGPPPPKPPLLSPGQRSASLARDSPYRQPVAYEPHVIVTSGQPPPGDVTLRRPKLKSRRNNDVLDFNNLLETSHTIKGGRICMVTGCPGIGKSALAINAADRVLNDTEMGVIPVLVDARACPSAARVLVRLVRELGVRFQQKDIDVLISWLASAKEKILLVFDNLDLPPSEDESISALFNALLKADSVHILATSRRRFYRGDTEVEHVQLGGLNEAAFDVLRDLAMDLPEESIQELAAVCGDTPFALQLVINALALAEDPASLYASIVRLLDDNDVSERWKNALGMYKGSDASRLPKMLCLTKAAVDHLPPAMKSLLRKLCVFEFPFDEAIAKAVLKDSVLCDALDALTKKNTVDLLLYAFAGGKQFLIPDLVRIVLPPMESYSDNILVAYRNQCMETLSTACNRYHSKECFQAMTSVWAGYDLLVSNLMIFSKRPHASVKTSQVLTSPRMCIFLHDVLAAVDFEHFYKNLLNTAKDPHSLFIESCTLCCLSYHARKERDYEEALAYAEQASFAMPKGENVEQEVAIMFCSLCLAKAQWHASDDKLAAMNLAKQSLESFKIILGLQNPLTVYAYEDYALMEKDLEHFQKARYHYNMIDFIAEDMLGLHPCMLRGYDSRREIWERQGLFSRAASVAHKAADIAVRFFGDHPLTAAMHARLCECMVKSGDTLDSIRMAARALNTREQLLGTHLDTALSNKMFAYLMLRKGHYGLALQHGQRALDMCTQLRVHRRFVKDIEIMLTQARWRQQSTESTYVKLETHRHSKSLDNVLANDITTITTEV